MSSRCMLNSDPPDYIVCNKFAVEVPRLICVNVDLNSSTIDLAKRCATRTGLPRSTDSLDLSLDAPHQIRRALGHFCSDGNGYPCLKRLSGLDWNSMIKVVVRTSNINSHSSHSQTISPVSNIPTLSLRRYSFHLSKKSKPSSVCRSKRFPVYLLNSKVHV